MHLPVKFMCGGGGLQLLVCLGCWWQLELLRDSLLWFMLAMVQIYFQRVALWFGWLGRNLVFPYSFSGLFGLLI